MLPAVLEGLWSAAVVLIVGCLMLDVWLALRARAMTGRWLGVLPIIAILWVAYYPVRVIMILVDRDNPLFHPATRAATDGDLLWVGLVSTAGLAAVIGGAWVVQSTALVRPSRGLDLRRNHLTLASLVGVAVAMGALVFRSSSGIIANVGPVALLGLAGMGFLDARRGEFSWRTSGLVLVTMLAGSASGFKEFAVLPIAAWGVGMVAGRSTRLPLRVALPVATLAFLAYVAVAGQRIGTNVGEPASLPSALMNALTRYDLESGTVMARPKHGWDILGDPGAALSRRLSGVESLLIFRRQVPERTEYQAGRTFVLPTLTLLPGGSSLVEGTPFPQLSLGRYYALRFYSLTPQSDPSSQAITWAGELYLNFGTTGIIVGLLFIGALLSAFDQRYPPVSAFNVGVLAYAGTAALGLERNIAYVLVTVVIRLVIASVFRRLVYVRSARDSRQRNVVGFREAGSVGNPTERGVRYG